MDTGEDLESLLRQLLQHYRSNGIDFILGIRYNDSVGQDSFLLRHTTDRIACRNLTRMLWESLKDESKPTKVVDDSDED